MNLLFSRLQRPDQLADSSPSGFVHLVLLLLLPQWRQSDRVAATTRWRATAGPMSAADVGAKRLFTNSVAREISVGKPNSSVNGLRSNIPKLYQRFSRGTPFLNRMYRGDRCGNIPPELVRNSEHHHGGRYRGVACMHRGASLCGPVKAALHRTHRRRFGKLHQLMQLVSPLQGWPASRRGRCNMLAPC
jgi:hypothetical protein